MSPLESLFRLEIEIQRRIRNEGATALEAMVKEATAARASQGVLGPTHAPAFACEEPSEKADGAEASGRDSG